jgi:endonuclease/exonuclease/phosphatase family metal-dependent hydrolase
VRIVTWNVWWRFGGNWRERQSQILATLERANADVICLQEVWEGEGTSQAEWLATGLRMHPAFAAPSLPPTPDPPEYEDQEAIGLGVAVLSRWPVLRRHVHLLPSRHRTAPVALVVTLDHPAGPIHVVSACVEWEAEFADDHLAQTRALAALVASPELDGPLPVVLGADLNAGPGTALVEPLTEVMADAWVAAGAPGEGVTLSSQNPFAPLEAVNQIDQRIDYVLVRHGHRGQPVEVTHAELAGNHPVVPAPSDHYAVVADLTL